MQEQIDQLRREVAELRRTIGALERSLTQIGMPPELRSAIRAEVVRPQDGSIPFERTITIDAVDYQFLAAPAGVIIIKGPNGAEYPVPYLPKT